MRIVVIAFVLASIIVLLGARAARACDHGSFLVEELVGFDARGGAWIVEGEVRRGDRKVTSSLQLVRRNGPGTTVLERREGPRYGGRSLPSSADVVRDARALIDVQPGLAPEAAGFIALVEIAHRGDDSEQTGDTRETCAAERVAEWRVELGGLVEIARVFRIDDVDYGTASFLAAAEPAVLIAPDRSIAVTTMQVNRAINWHEDRVSYARVMHIDPRCVGGGPGASSRSRCMRPVRPRGVPRAATSATRRCSAVRARSARHAR